MLHTDVSVVIPARNEAGTVAGVVRAIAALRDTGQVAEVIVVDDGSTDATAAVAREAGARVVRATSGPGKGSAMQDGVAAAAGDIVVFCDADLTDFDARVVTTLAAAFTPGTVLVKGDHERPGQGGRVTELVARPVLRLLHPQLAHLAQPLGGEYAAWRTALEEVPFVCGYGVELGLLLDLAARHGAGAIAEVHLGVRRHRNRTLAELAPQAEEVLAVALQRAGVPGVSVEERPPLASPGPLASTHPRRPRRSA